VVAEAQEASSPFETTSGGQVMELEGPAEREQPPELAGAVAEVTSRRDGEAVASNTLPATSSHIKDLSEWTRPQLIQAVFHALDADGDGRLMQAEARRFAELTNFDGNDEEWNTAYELIFIDRGGDPQDGMDEVLFADLVNDENEETGCYCTDYDLRLMLEMLCHKAPPALPRRGLIHAVFLACDSDGNGLLSRDEMRRFAELSAFDGSDTQWADAYGVLCSENDVDPHAGVDEALLAQLIDDEEHGWYCSDDDLHKILRGLQAAAPLSRQEILRAIFAACDMDGDGCLSLEEMHGFALFTGFEGDNEAWEAEFKRICLEGGASIASGMDWRLFHDLLEDTSDRGLHCSDQELRSMLPLLQRRSCGVLAGAVFRALDGDHDGLLSAPEFAIFARRSGWATSNEQCDGLFSRLCSAASIGAERGISRAAFTAAILEEAGSTDDALRKLLRELSADGGGAEAAAAGL